MLLFRHLILNKQQHGCCLASVDCLQIFNPIGMATSNFAPRTYWETWLLSCNGNWLMSVKYCFPLIYASTWIKGSIDTWLADTEPLFSISIVMRLIYTITPLSQSLCWFWLTLWKSLLMLMIDCHEALVAFNWCHCLCEEVNPYYWSTAVFSLLLFFPFFVFFFKYRYSIIEDIAFIPRWIHEEEG